MNALMLVSADAGPQTRADVALSRRPRLEFLELESRFGVTLLDRRMAGLNDGGRSAANSLRHVAAARRLLDRHGAVLSDGEHVGIPLAISLALRPVPVRHVMIGHQLTTRAKRPFFRWLGVQRRIDRVIVHSRGHLEAAHAQLGIPRSRLANVPYAVDTDFWSPEVMEEQALVVAPGRDHRDFRTLARAVDGLDCSVFVTGSSLHSPGAQASAPEQWPATVEHGFVDYVRLRSLYARASVIVVPLLEVDFPAGVTAVLEGMAMGKAVIVTGTRGIAGIVEDGVTGLIVPPGNAERMRDSLRRLLAAPGERARLGANARSAVTANFRLEAYCSKLATELGLDPQLAPAGRLERAR